MKYLTYEEYDLIHYPRGEFCVTYKSGTIRYFKDGQKHRTDGPAVISTHGHKFWYVDGQVCIFRETFRHRANISDEDMAILILKYGDEL